MKRENGKQVNKATFSVRVQCCGYLKIVTYDLAAAGVGNGALGECLQGNTDPEFFPWRENASKLSMLARAPNPSVQETEADELAWVM